MVPPSQGQFPHPRVRRRSWCCSRAAAGAASRRSCVHRAWRSASL